MVKKVKSQNKDGYAVKVISRLQKRTNEANKVKDLAKEQSQWDINQINELKKERSRKGFNDIETTTN
jgi:hypothetical protein